MNCQAQINDHLGHKSKCGKQATVNVTTITEHKNGVTKKVRNLCGEHRKRLVARHRYQIKHCGKKTKIIELYLGNGEHVGPPEMYLGDGK